MRPLEILLALLVVMSASAGLIKRTPRPLLSWLCALDLLALAVHAILEGPHWQMIPAYAAALIFPAVYAIRQTLPRRILALAMLALVLVSCIASALLPMFRLPRPTGVYPIGTRILHLVNGHPSDPASAGVDGKRELMVQVWYPASPSHAPRAPYRIRAETTLLSSYQAVLWTHSRWSAPVAGNGAAFPVLLFNPGWSGRRTSFTYLVEDLASHGYIVIAIDHTGNSGPTAFPDGHIGQPNIDPNLDFSTHTYSQLMSYGTRQLEVQVDDNRFVLDQFQAWNQDPASPFYRRIDMDRVGALGHSFGGAVSAQVCLEDSRIKSALDMDGSLWGQVLQIGLHKPFMMIEEDITEYTPAQLAQDNADRNNHLLDQGDLAMLRKSGAYRILLHGSTHPSFSDRNFFSPVKSYSGVGTIPPYREALILRTLVLAFFDKTLRGQTPAVFNETASPFPETSLQMLNPLPAGVHGN